MCVDVAAGCQVRDPTGPALLTAVLDLLAEAGFFFGMPICTAGARCTTSKLVKVSFQKGGFKKKGKTQ